MKTSDITDFFTSNEVDGALSPQQAAQLLNLGLQGDTGAPAPETGGAPASTPAADKTPDPSSAETTANSTAPAPSGAPATPAEPDKDTAVLLAKDGVHTIPYEKLEQARQGEQHWKAQAEATQLEVAALKAAAQVRAHAGQAPTPTDQQVAAAQAAIDAGVDPELFGDFSEAALARGIQTLVDQRVASMVTAKLDEALAPLREQQVQGAHDAHYSAIYAKHPDADSMAAIAAAQPPVPASLSDIPGGRAVGGSVQEQLAADLTS